MTNQQLLQNAIIDTLTRHGNRRLTISEINENVWNNFEDDLMDHEIEWTWQHLIASARKHLVDNGSIIRDGKTYCLA